MTRFARWFRLPLGAAKAFVRRGLSSDVRPADDQLRLALKSAAAVAWDWDVNTGRDTWFGDLTTTFGLPGDTYEGKVEDFRRRVHPDDRDLVWRAVAHARKTSTMYNPTFRLVREDGTIRWVSAIGKFYYGADGEAVRMLGIAQDVTEQKRATEALSKLSRKLMEHHESERTTIARELHDEIGERIALLIVELEHLSQLFSKERLAADVGPHVRELCGRAVELGKDIQAISHRLHSSKLEFVGITVAAADFCKDLCNQRRVSIDFSHEGIPRDLPREIGLCLFRVLQEALHNGLTHARVRHFTVTLCGTPTEIQLEVADKGIGFDLATATGHHALGLIGMKERMSMVNGEIVFDSRPGGGTTVRASVPLVAERSDILEREQIKFLRCDGPEFGEVYTM